VNLKKEKIKQKGRKSVIVDKTGFKQDIHTCDSFGEDFGHCVVEIHISPNTRLSQEDMTEFLQELASYFHEAYTWAAVQLGIASKCEAEKSKPDSFAYMTRDEIKATLAPRYEEVRAKSEEQAALAWEELTERNDTEVFKHICECAAHTWQFACGIQTAAEALGISSGELIMAAGPTRPEGGIG